MNVNKVIMIFFAVAGCGWFFAYPLFITFWLDSWLKPQTWLEQVGCAVICCGLSVFCLISIIAFFIMVFEEEREKEYEEIEGS